MTHIILTKIKAAERRFLDYLRPEPKEAHDIWELAAGDAAPTCIREVSRNLRPWSEMASPDMISPLSQCQRI